MDYQKLSNDLDRIDAEVAEYERELATADRWFYSGIAAVGAAAILAVAILRLKG